MRILLIVLIVLLPLGAAVFFFMRRSENGNQPRIREVGGEKSAIDMADMMVGTEGKKLFTVIESTAKIDGAEVVFPARYLWLGAFKKSPRGDVLAEDILFILNATPKTKAAFDALLVLRTSDDVAMRERAMREAAATHTSIAAATGVLGGGPTVERATTADLVDAVFRSVDPLDAAAAATLKTKSARAGFGDGGLSSLDAPGAVSFERAGLSVSGDTLVLRPGRESLRLEKAIAIVATKSAGPPMTVNAGGPLVFTSAVEAQPGAELFESLDLNGGSIHIGGGARLVDGDLTVEGRDMDAVLADRAAPKGAAAFKSLTVRGAVKLNTPEGLVTGEEAVIVPSDGGGFQATVIGTPARLLRGDGSKDVSDRLDLSCNGPMVLVKHPGKGPDAGRLTLEKRVKLVAGDPADPLRALDGEKLVVDFVSVAVNKEDAAGKTVVAMRRAELFGKSVGRLDGFDIDGSGLVVERFHDEYGVLVRETAALDGPGSVRQLPKANDVRKREATLEAKKSIVIERAVESSETVVRADGAAHWRQLEDGAVALDVVGRRLTVVIGPAEALEPGETPRSLLKSARVEGEVRIEDATGLVVLGDSARVFGEEKRFEVDGAPCRVDWPRGEGHLKRLWKAAGRSFVYDATKGRLDGSGNVTATVFLEDIPLSFSPTEKTPEDLGPFGSRPVPGPVEWATACKKFRIELDRGPDGKANRMRTMNLEGAVTFENPTKKIVAESIYFDASIRQGRAVGSPVVFTSKDPDHPEREDRIEAGVVTLNDTTTHLAGPCDFKLHLAADDAFGPGVDSAPSAPKVEILTVKTPSDIVVSSGAITFSGRTVMTRGDVAHGGLTMTSDTARIRTAGAGVGKITQVDGFGNVDFAFGKTKGEGDVISLDLAARLVSVRGTTKMGKLSIDGSYPSTYKSMTYDITKDVIRFDEASTTVEKK